MVLFLFFLERENVATARLGGIAKARIQSVTLPADRGEDLGDVFRSPTVTGGPCDTRESAQGLDHARGPLGSSLLEIRPLLVLAPFLPSLLGGCHCRAFLRR